MLCRDSCFLYVCLCSFIDPSYNVTFLRSSVSNGRPYSDCNVFKVFRFQRKTLLLLLCFFSSIIKVFRFQRKTLLLLLCFFFTIIFILFFFCHVFLKMLQPIFMKLSDLIHDKICKKSTRDFFDRHFRYRDIKDFTFLLVHDFSQKVFQIGLSNFQRR